MEGLKMLRRAFVTQLEAAEVAEPTQGAFDDVARLSQAAAVFVGAPRLQERSNPPRPDLGDRVGEPVAGVALEHGRLGPRPAARAGDGRERVQQRRDPLLVAFVGRAGLHDQGQPAGVGQHVTLAAFFAAVGRVGPSVRPPKTARTLALSTTPRAASTAPAWPSRPSSRPWMAGQTPASVQSRSRRQQVTPLPQPISAGTIDQAMPDLSTKTMPARAFRSSTRGRPPSGQAGRLGIRGSISAHSSSEISAAMRSPPCYAQRLDIPKQSRF